MLLNSVLDVNQLVKISADRVQFDTLETVIERELYTNDVIRKELLRKIHETMQVMSQQQQVGDGSKNADR